MIRGSIVALITPFTEDNKINFNKIRELLDFHINNQTDAILLFGTTGEGFSLSIKEKIKIVKLVYKHVKNKIPIIINAGTNSTWETIKNIKNFNKFRPYAFLVITPYYNKTNEEGVFNHYKEIIKYSDSPLIIYNVPSRTAYDISINNIKRLSLEEKIIGIKEASNDINKLKKLSKLQSEKFYWYSGNDNRLIDDLKLGAKGLVGVVTNIFPKEIKSICLSYSKQDFEHANAEYEKLKEIINVLSIDINPIPIKEMMNLFSFNVGGFRLPLFRLSEEKLLMVKGVIDKL